jgi:hypothetical protein
MQVMLSNLIAAQTLRPSQPPAAARAVTQDARQLAAETPASAGREDANPPPVSTRPGSKIDIRV